MPQYLDELADSLAKWYNLTGKEVKNTNNVNQSRVGNVITGYKKKSGGQAINGLLQVRRNPKVFGQILDKIKNCSDTIRLNFGDNLQNGKEDTNASIDMSIEPVSGIKTIRK